MPFFLLFPPSSGTAIGGSQGSSLEGLTQDWTQKNKDPRLKGQLRTGRKRAARAKKYQLCGSRRSHSNQNKTKQKLLGC